MWLLIQSLIAYTLFAFAMYSAAKRVTEQETLAMQYPRHWYSLPRGYWVCILIFTIVSGIRWDVGVDHLAYLEDYQEALNGVEWMRGRGVEEAYMLVVNSFSSIGLHPTIFFAFFAFLQIFFVVLAMREEREVMPYMMLVLVLGNFYLAWMNVIRQMIVSCSFVWACKFIDERNFKKYLVWMAFAYLWHHSSLMLLPLLLLSYDKTIWDKKWINLGILAACIVLGNTPTWTGFMTNLGGLFDFMGYDYYSERLGSLTDMDNMRSHSFGPRMLVILVSYVFVIYYYPAIRKLKNSSKFDLFFKFFMIGICLNYLFDNTVEVFRRPSKYFEIFSLPLIAYTLDYLKNIKQSRFWFYILVASAMSFMMLQCYSEINTDEFLRKSTLFQFYFASH